MARKLSAKFFENETVQPVAEPSEGRTTQIIPQTDKVPMQEKITHRELTANPSAQKRELQLKNADNRTGNTNDTANACHVR